MKLRYLAILLLGAAPLFAATQVVVLGSGMPAANPDRFGPAVAIVTNDTAYLVDCGVGVVRRAAAAVQRDHIPALAAARLKIVFITHLHSDHTLGYPDLILSPWVLHRTEPLRVYGPPGLSDMTEHILAAWKKDIDVRMHGLEGHSSPPVVQVHEIKPGVIYKDANVTVTAFAVKHGSWDYAYGYRFDTSDRSIVISGDTAPTDAIVQACHGCDLLLHEMFIAPHTSDARSWSASDVAYFQSFHTSPEGLAKIANEAKPKLLVLYHQMGWPINDGEMLDALRQNGYQGAAASAHDLDVF